MSLNLDFGILLCSSGESTFLKVFTYISRPFPDILNPPKGQ